MCNGKTIFGIILIAIGGLFILDKFNIFRGIDFFDFWPVVLIVVGIVMIVRHNKRTRYDSTEKVYEFENYCGSSKYSRVFDDSNLTFKDTEVDGLNVSTVFGDNSLNLADAKLKQGINRMSVSGVFGDLTIIIPGHMEVSANGSTVFGDVHILGKTVSGISNKLQNQTDNYDSASSKVDIWCSTTFGDIKIYRA